MWLIIICKKTGHIRSFSFGIHAVSNIHVIYVMMQTRQISIFKPVCLKHHSYSNVAPAGATFQLLELCSTAKEWFWIRYLTHRGLNRKRMFQMHILNGNCILINLMELVKGPIVIKSALIQVQGTYMNQCWLRCLKFYGVTNSQRLIPTGTEVGIL